MKFYKIEVGSLNQYKYAWYELTDNANISNDHPKCPQCGRAVGNHYWLPPFEVIIKQPHNIGDFLSGFGCDLMVSEKFKRKYEESELTGVVNFYPITIKKMGTTKKSNELIKPLLFGTNVKRTFTRVIYEEMAVTWGNPPSNNYCKFCGPGGGGGAGIYYGYERIVVDEKTWSGEDIFFCINMPGNVLLSERAAKFIVENNFTNCEITPCSEAKFSYFSR